MQELVQPQPQGEIGCKTPRDVNKPDVQYLSFAARPGNKKTDEEDQRGEDTGIDPVQQTGNNHHGEPESLWRDVGGTLCRNLRGSRGRGQTVLFLNRGSQTVPDRVLPS